ncbi:OmpW/AlkL family protein [Coralliovum pocilloporae]|uniref:OmpW/AlkL family protein n=1 Tax=Coralliovum pocilloporae TaxID=3066369 RepID=UPI00330716DF
MTAKIKQALKACTLLTGLVFAATTFSDATQAAEGDSPWQVRVRGIFVVPDEGAKVGTIGGGVDIDNTFVPELDITYFFTDHIAAELILATTPHDVSSTVVGRLGDVWLLPPTLTLQYHFLPNEKFRPYVGAGINYTIFFNEDPDGVATSIDYDDAFGWALQAGIDVDLGNNWLFNVDVKKIFLETDVTINGAIQADVDIDPWIIGAGFGYRF